MESSNAILLKIPEKRGESFGYDNYGVKQEYTCIPEVPSPFEYSFVDVFDADGQLQAPSLEELRKNACACFLINNIRLLIFLYQRMAPSYKGRALDVLSIMRMQKYKERVQ